MPLVETEIIPVQIDKDIEIFNQRILHILERTIRKIKLVNVIMECHKKKLARASLGNRDLLLETFHRFFNTSESDLNKKQCCNVIDEMLQSLDYTKLEVVPVNKESPQVELFVQCMRELQNNVEFHQQENVTQERAREKEIHRAQLRNDQAKKEIAALEQELIIKKSDLNASIIGKNILLNRHQAKIVKIQKTTKEAIERRKEESKSTIEFEQRASQQNQQELNKQVNENIVKHKLLLEDHLLLEKQLRMQRKKIENQLAAWMEKFDQDMSEKQEEEEELTNKFDEEKKQYEEVQKRLDEQEEEYDELMQEKAAYEQEVLEQKLFIFILNRSARRIQRSFRAYKLRKMAKKAKKGKKGKGKKK